MRRYLRSTVSPHYFGRPLSAPGTSSGLLGLPAIRVLFRLGSFLPASPDYAPHDGREASRSQTNRHCLCRRRGTHGRVRALSRTAHGTGRNSGGACAARGACAGHDVPRALKDCRAPNATGVERRGTRLESAAEVMTCSGLTNHAGAPALRRNARRPEGGGVVRSFGEVRALEARAREIDATQHGAA